MGETIGYSSDLHVEKVRLNRCRRTYFYKSPRHKIYGEALRIQIPKEETTFEVDIAYRWVHAFLA